jgi:hypothetical protein
MTAACPYLWAIPFKTPKIPVNMANLGQNPKKTCGNPAFRLDFTGLKAAWLPSAGFFESRMNTSVSH